MGCARGFKGGNRNPPSLGCLWFLSAQAERNAPGRADNTSNRNRFCSKENRSAAISHGERPPAGPFLNDQKGAKESVKEGDFDFPLLDNPPLKTTKHRGELRLPPIGCTPQVFYCYAACTVGLLRNAAGARCAGADVPSGGWRRDLTLD